LRLPFLLLLSAIATLALASACDSGGGNGHATDDGVADDDAADDDEEWMSDGCFSGTGTPGTFDGAITSDGFERTYILDVPASYDGSPTALVIDLHGTGASAQAQKALSGFSDKGSAEGFITVHPESMEYDAGAKVKSWIIANCDNRDTAFMNDLIEKVEADYCIDTRRIYFAGISNGAFFTHILGAIMTDELAAIAPVAGGLGVVGKLCSPTAPLPVVIIHGDADEIVPVELGREARDFWAAHNNCTKTTDGPHNCELHTNCTNGADVLYCEIAGGHHRWPHGEFEATDVVWEFFKSHTRTK